MLNSQHSTSRHTVVPTPLSELGEPVCLEPPQVLADYVSDLIVRDTTHVASTRLFMLIAEYPYIPPRSETEEEADFLHASSEDVLVRLLS